MASRQLRANDVEVETIRRARCKLPACGWKGGEHTLYPGANADRQAHMTWHREGEPGGAAEVMAEVSADLDEVKLIMRGLNSLDRKSLTEDEMETRAALAYKFGAASLRIMKAACGDGQPGGPGARAGG